MGNKEKKQEKGKTQSLCKKVKFTLDFTLNFDNNTTKKLTTSFLSRPHVPTCNHPNSRDFNKAYRKVITEYKNSLSKETLSKETLPKVKDTKTQVTCTTSVGGSVICSCGHDETGIGYYGVCFCG
jgi:hypothetical protein